MNCDDVGIAKNTQLIEIDIDITATPKHVPVVSEPFSMISSTTTTTTSTTTTITTSSTTTTWTTTTQATQPPNDNVFVKKCDIDEDGKQICKIVSVPRSESNFRYRTSTDFSTEALKTAFWESDSSDYDSSDWSEYDSSIESDDDSDDSGWGFNWGN